MSRFPDNFDAAASGCFPTAADLRAAERDRMAEQMGSAVSRIDSACDELLFHIGGMASPPDAERSDVEDAQALATELEAIVAKRRPGRAS